MKLDAIVVHGGNPDHGVIRNRWKVATRLYHTSSGKPQVLPTGGRPYGNMQESEAESGRKLGIYFGIPGHAMPELEDRSNSMFGMAYNAKVNFILPKNWKSVAWVTNDIFRYRTALIVSKIVGGASQNIIVPAPTPYQDRYRLLKDEIPIRVFSKIILSGIENGGHDATKNRVRAVAPVYAKLPLISELYERTARDFA